MLFLNLIKGANRAEDKKENEAIPNNGGLATTKK
jgi:hypothetical protein